jgi:hypothetical protein
MAEETNINPLDSLGPQVGNMNLPDLTSKSFQPFEGQSIAPNNINIPFDPLPINYVPRQDFNVKDKSVGHLFGNDPAKNKNIDSNDFVDSLKAKIFARGEEQAKDQYSRLYSYDAGPSGQNFYKRYAAFGDKTFEKIGFSPLRNNESIYNANTTWGQRYTKMLTHSAWPLFKSGFTAGPRSLMRMLDGDFGTDPEDARIYGEASAIGMDTSGGVGAFMTNLQMNFAYTAGIVTEAILEEVAGAVLAPATGGASFAAATLNNARKLPLLGKAIGTAVKGATTANAFGKSLKAANDINNARKLWSLAGLERMTASSLGKFINPAENTMGAIFSSIKNADNLQGLARAYNTGYKTAGGFYRDVRAINMALSEARLEGGFVQNELYNDLYREYYDIHGEAPTDELQKDLRKQALEGGMQTQIWNSWLIYASNKVVFPNIVGPRGGLRSFMTSKTDDILDLKFGKVKKTMVTPEGSKIAKPKYEWVENSFKNTIKESYKQPLRKLVPAVGNYFKANVMEGLQENFQEVIAGASKNYHTELFKDKNRASYEYYKGLSGVTFSDYLRTSAKEHFATSGLETFASGFFMGFLGGGLNKSFDYLSTGVNYIKDKEAYMNHKAAKNQYGKSIVANLSSIDVKNFFDSRTFNFSEQLKTISKESVTEKLSRDLSHQQFMSQLTQVLDHGMMEMFVDHLASYKNLTVEEFQEALGFETPEAAQNAQLKIDSVLENSRKVQKRYDENKERFPDPISSKDFAEIEKLGKDSIEYQNAAFLNQAWRVSRNNAVFFGESYDNTRKRMQGIVNNMITNSPLSEANSQHLNILFEPRKMYNEVDMLKSEIEAATQAGISNSDIVTKKKRLNALENYIEKLDEYYKFNRSEDSLKERVISLYLSVGKEFTDEEVDAQVKKLKKEITEEDIINSQNQLEVAYKNYLKAISGLSNDTIFDEAIDKSFVDFLDYYTLADESKALAKAINILHDPKGFVQHVEDNMVWMKNLYNNRKDYYTEMVNTTLNNNLANDILNSLASEAIYLSAEDFENFIKYGILPSEFYDDAKKIVIKRNHPLYDRYAEVLNQYSDAKNNPIGKSTGSEKLDENIEKLDKQMQAELDRLPKVEQRRDLDSIEIDPGKTITYKNLFDKVETGTYVDIVYFVKGQENKATLYRTETGFKFNNENGDDVTLGSRTRIKEAKPYIIEMVPDPTEAAEVIKKYDDLKAQAVVENTEEEFRETPDSSQKISFNIDDIQAKSPDLLTELQRLFEESVGAETLENYDDAQFREEFERFIKINNDARKLINDYNNGLDVRKSLDKDDEIVLKINHKGQEVDINTLPLNEVQNALTQRKLYLKNLEAEEKPNTSLIATIKKEINVITKFLKNKEISGLTARQKEIINILEKLGAAEYPIVNGRYLINNIVHKRVSNLVEELSGKKYEYTSKDILETLMLNAFRGKTLTAATLKEFIKLVEDNIKNESSKQRRLSGFDFTDKVGVSQSEYGQDINTSLEKTIAALETLLKAKTGASYTDIKQDIINIFAENSYEESRVVGNYIDEAIRDFFDGVQPKFDPNRITQEAYDRLFGDMTTTDQEGNPIKVGILSNIKDTIEKEGLYIYSKGITLYDSDAQVAGTIDLILVDKNGQVYIVDVKTGDKNKWSHFSSDKLAGFDKNLSDFTLSDKNSKVENYTLQQAIYANLLYNMTGIDAKISLLPIEQEADKTTAKIISLDTPSVTETGKSRINLNKDYRISKDSETVREKVDKAIPRKEQVVTTAPVSTDAKADNIISNGDRIINVQTKSVTDEITDTDGELFITSDKDTVVESKSLDQLQAEASALTGETISLEEQRIIDETDTLIQERINNYNIPVYDFFSEMPERYDRVLSRALNGIPVDKTAFEEALSFVYNAYKEVIRLKDPANNAERLQKSLTTDMLDSLEKELTEDLNYFVNYQTQLKYGQPVEKIPDIQAEVQSTSDASSSTRRTETRTSKEKENKKQLKVNTLIQEITSTASQASLDWLNQKENELAQLIDFLTPEQAIQLGEIIENRRQKLAPDTEITSTPSISVEKGLKLTAETSIFSTRNPNKQIGQRGDIAVVSNVNEAKGTVTIKIKSDGKTSSLTISLEELDKMFKLYNEVMVKDTDVVKARLAEEQTTVKASNDTAANFVENEELQKQAETKESKMTDDEVDNNLLDDLDC